MASTPRLLRLWSPSCRRVSVSSSWYRCSRRGLASAASTQDPDYRRMILESRVYDVAVQTPLQHAPALSNVLKNRVYFKREDLQPVFSFKIRGAYNKMANLTPKQKQAGVVCCSAGNHAQGVALSAKKLGINATIVMPLATPEIKVDSVTHHGGEFINIVLHGKSFDDAAAEAKRLEQQEHRTMILPFDDPHVIAGQGTIGMEILQQTSGKPLDGIFVTCGGGGLLSGVAAWVKNVRPGVKMIGVEAADAPGMTESLLAGKPVELDRVGLFADGAAVKLIGKETFRVCQQYVDEMVTVSTDEICAAIKHVFNDTRVILEPAGAMAVAGMTKYLKSHGITGGAFAAITSGANIDFARLRFVSERADAREHLLSVQIPERPGEFRQLCHRLDHSGVVVTEFSYRYADHSNALVHLSFQAPSNDHADAAMTDLTTQGYQVLDLTDNELAKVHTRYLAGGRARQEQDCEEVLCRVEFPHLHGALTSFLDQLQGEWNISLFHYRNHGADVGRVLVGFQVPPSDRERFQTFLDGLNYQVVDETENEIYQQFLR